MCTFFNPNTFAGLVGKVQKNSPEGGRKGGWRKKARAALAGPGARSQGGCLDKQAFPCLLIG